MRRLTVDELQPGMVIARTVVGSDGRALLTKNNQLTTGYILRLKSLGLGSVYVKDSFTEDDIEVPEIVSQKVVSAVTGNLKESIKRLDNKKSVDMNTMRKGVALLLEDIMDNRNLLIQLEDIRSYSDYLLFHSINVAVFCMMTGMTLGYLEGSLMDLGMGALLHDIGMINIDPEVLQKPGALTSEERAQIAQHPEVGFNILRTYREVSTLSAHVAYQHHEHVDGSGYPREITDNHILEFGKIAAIADTFDAIISDRPYRKGYSTTEGVLVLRKLAGTYFDPNIVEAFVANVALYPAGCLVSLNTGHIAVVTSITKSHPNSPVILVICDPSGNFIKPPYEIDLRKTNEVKISKRLSTEETDAVRNRITAR
ncbi:MAG: HD-GYP domain-containing protein [Candidatus Saccharibacteria bacterium]